LLLGSKKNSLSTVFLLSDGLPVTSEGEAALLILAQLPFICEKIYNSNVDQIKEWAFMQVSKWGNSLAVRLPSEVVEALNLKEGDQIEIRIADTREFEVRRDPGRQRALERLRRLRRPLPAGFVFDRAEANAR
jgi:antitoxin MazE